MEQNEVTESIISGETDTVVNHLLRNSFGDKLQSIHSRNSSMGYNTLNLDNIFNEIEISKELPSNLEVSVEFLKSMANPKVICIYSVETGFNATESRHMSV